MQPSGETLYSKPCCCALFAPRNVAIVAATAFFVYGVLAILHGAGIFNPDQLGGVASCFTSAAISLVIAGIILHNLFKQRSSPATQNPVTNAPADSTNPFDEDVANAAPVASTSLTTTATAPTVAPKKVKIADSLQQIFTIPVISNMLGDLYRANPPKEDPVGDSNPGEESETILKKIQSMFTDPLSDDLTIADLQKLHYKSISQLSVDNDEAVVCFSRVLPFLTLNAVLSYLYLFKTDEGSKTQVICDAFNSLDEDATVQWHTYLTRSSATLPPGYHQLFNNLANDRIRNIHDAAQT